MKIIKNFRYFITEGGDPFAADAQGSTTKPKPKSEQPTEKKPSSNTTTASKPDSSIKDSLLKIPGSYIGKSETVVYQSKAVGRQYDFYFTKSRVKVWPIEGDNNIYSGSFSIAGDVITTKSDDGKTSEKITISSGSVVGLPKNLSREELQTSAAAAIKNKLNSVDVNESSVIYMLEALIHYIISNNLNANDAKSFILNVLSKKTIKDIANALDTDWVPQTSTIFTFGGMNTTAEHILKAIMNWQINWAPEDDEDNQVLINYGTIPLASRTPVDDKEADLIAQSAWNIVDDTIVTKDEEVNAAFAVMMLSKQGLAKVEQRWEKLKTQGRIDTSQGFAQRVADEIDVADAGKLLSAFARAVSGKPSANSVNLLNSWLTA